MLAIRLSRVGKKKQPSYRLIVSEKTKDTWGTFIENIGTYNPLTNPHTVAFNADRIHYWIGKGAQCSDTAWNLCVDAKIVEGEKRNKIKMTTKHKAKLAKKAST